MMSFLLRQHAPLTKVSRCITLNLLAPGDDDNLIQWQKSSKPLIELPPVGLGQLAGWRDPFIVSRPGQMGCDEWVMLVGSGIKEVGGSVLVYKSSSLTEGGAQKGAVMSSYCNLH
jgi:hypothetical protein